MSIADYPLSSTMDAAYLEGIASQLASPGKGLLASDESTGTIGKRLEKAGLRNDEVGLHVAARIAFSLRRCAAQCAPCSLTPFQHRTTSTLARRQGLIRTPLRLSHSPLLSATGKQASCTPSQETRRAYRELFYTADMGSSISGAIMFKETLYQSAADGTPFVQCLAKQGVLPGIKVDEVRCCCCWAGVQAQHLALVPTPSPAPLVLQGLLPIEGHEGETSTRGLEALEVSCREYVKAGAKFAKWRAALRLGDGQPSELAVQTNAEQLAQYAQVCQVGCLGRGQGGGRGGAGYTGEGSGLPVRRPCRRRDGPRCAGLPWLLGWAVGHMTHVGRGPGRDLQPAALACRSASVSAWMAAWLVSAVRQGGSPHCVCTTACAVRGGPAHVQGEAATLHTSLPPRRPAGPVGPAPTPRGACGAEGPQLPPPPSAPSARPPPPTHTPAAPCSRWAWCPSWSRRCSSTAATASSSSPTPRSA
jgi:hypothetical protein